MTRQRSLDTTSVGCLYAADPETRPHCQLTAVVAYGAIALCADCDAQRSTIGKGSTPQRLPAPQPLDILDWLRRADRQLRQAHTELTAAVQRARAHGHSWQAIGDQLNITRQAAQQRFQEDRPPPG